MPFEGAWPVRSCEFIGLSNPQSHIVRSVVVIKPTTDPALRSVAIDLGLRLCLPQELSKLHQAWLSLRRPPDLSGLAKHSLRCSGLTRPTTSLSRQDGATSISNPQSLVQHFPRHPLLPSPDDANKLSVQSSELGVGTIFPCSGAVWPLELRAGTSRRL